MPRSSAPRVPLIVDRDEVPEGDRQVYDYIEKSRGGVHGPFAILLRSPELAAKIAELGEYIRFESRIPGDKRELAIITVAREYDCAFEWTAHEPIAQQEGVRKRTIKVVANQEDLEGVDQIEKYIIRYVREISQDHQASEETFTALKDHFGVKDVTDLTSTIGYYIMIACILNSFNLVPEENTFEISH